MQGITLDNNRRPPSGPDAPECPIRIGIDALAWNDDTGYGRFCREIVCALLRISTRYRFTLLMADGVRAPDGADVVRCRAARTLPNLWKLTWTIARIPADLWFFPSPLHFVPVIARARVVVAVHDTIPWRYPELIFPSRAQRTAWRIKLRLAMRQASQVVTVSNYARECIARHFQLAESAIRIVGEAPAAAFKPVEDRAAVSAISDRLGVPRDALMIIYHGASLPHKNLGTLARAFAKLSREPAFEDVFLVLVGSNVPAFQEICHGIGRVRFPGALDDYDLALALNRATLAVLPSLEEGFGLSGIEAVACGTPLIATRKSALPEILGDAAVYFEPLDENGLYGHLAGLLVDAVQRRTLRCRGLERTAALTWDLAAMRLMEALDTALAGSRA